MPHAETTSKRSQRIDRKAGRNDRNKVESRYTVALAPSLADQVERYAAIVDVSKSKAIAALVRLGLEARRAGNGNSSKT